MHTVKMYEAKTQLSRLVEEVRNGEEVIILKGTGLYQCLCRIFPKTGTQPGYLKGKIRIAENFDAPLPEELLNAFGYYYDFSANHLDIEDKPEKVRLFLDKLRSRKQTSVQCQQAAHAISLDFEMQGLVRQGITSVDEADKEQNPAVELLPSPSLPPEQFVPTLRTPAFDTASIALFRSRLPGKN